jgi:hypothetical protein
MFLGKLTFGSLTISRGIKMLSETCHRKSDVGFLQSRAVVGSVAGDGDDLSVGVDLAVDDASNLVPML